jgi:Xylose isomerase-like TIM barrel
MLDSKSNLTRIGFSTGALEKGDFKTAFRWLLNMKVKSVEISALRLEELEPLVNALKSLPIKEFNYVSFHAPAFFPKEAEKHVVQLLEKVASYGWNIIVHPDVIRKPKLWKKFNSHLLIENMDRRKSIGRTVSELDKIFKELPDAKLCLDMAHARQLDTTLTLLSQLISRFSNRIAEIHISELDSRYQHQPMSDGALADYQKFTSCFNSTIPVIIESTLGDNLASLRMNELKLTQIAMHPKRGVTIKNQNDKNAASPVKNSRKAHLRSPKAKPGTTARQVFAS